MYGFLLQVPVSVCLMLFLGHNYKLRQCLEQPYKAMAPAEESVSHLELGFAV